MSAVATEIRRLSRLAAPVIVTQVSTMLMGVVDTIMVGRVSVEALGAVSLGHIWIFGTVIFAMGVIFGIDPVVAQAHGSGNTRRMALGLQRGIVLSGLLTVPIAVLWALADPGLRLLGQDPELASLAGRYVMVQIPSLPFFLVYFALRQYLQGRGIVAPAMWVALVANLFNVVANWALIFGHLGAPALGAVGAGVATALTRAFMLAGMLALTRVGRLTEGAWIPWGRDAFVWRGIREILAFGMPVGLQLTLEAWAFQVATLFAGRLGHASLAAHTIALNLASLAFMVPLGISMGAVTRVGNLVGERRLTRAQLASWVAFGMGAGVMTVSAVAFTVLRHQLPRLYTGDAEVLALSASILPVAAAFQLFDGTQVVGGGILRGMGRTRPAAVFNLVGYYALALPFAWFLGFRLGWGVAGVWWGLCIGLATVAVLLVLWNWRRGPASLRPEDLAALEAAGH